MNYIKKYTVILSLMTTPDSETWIDRHPKIKSIVSSIATYASRLESFLNTKVSNKTFSLYFLNVLQGANNTKQDANLELYSTIDQSTLLLQIDTEGLSILDKLLKLENIDSEKFSKSLSNINTISKDDAIKFMKAFHTLKCVKNKYVNTIYQLFIVIYIMRSHIESNDLYSKYIFNMKKAIGKDNSNYFLIGGPPLIVSEIILRYGEIKTWGLRLSDSNFDSKTICYISIYRERLNQYSSKYSSEFPEVYTIQSIKSITP